MGQVHTHNFRVLNRSQIHYGNGLRWIERCRCGYTVNCDASYVTFKTLKWWFDRDGLLMKVTGDSTRKTSVENGLTPENKKKESSDNNLGSQSEIKAE